MPSVVPSTLGSGQVALANTKAAWVNLRSGPGTNYDDIGDIRDNTLVQYYPVTQQGDWVYLEQYGKVGWVHVGFLEFEAVNANPPTKATATTPYDGQVGIWYWEGDSVQESSKEEVIRNIKSLSPAITQFWLKTSNGHLWQGRSDNKRALAVDGYNNITEWGEVCKKYGMELHAWCVPRASTSIALEAELMIQTANHPMVKSLNVDVEPDTKWYWTGTAEQVRELMLLVRKGVPSNYHIGMTVDPRPWHYNTIFPDAWRPFINSIHPMVYWATFSTTPDAALKQMYETWLAYGLPIIPIFQVDAPTNEIQAAHSLATSKYGASGISWWRYGVGSSVEMRALNLAIPKGGSTGATPSPTPSTTPTETPSYGDEILITPASPAFAKGSYTGKDEFKGYVQRMGWPVYYANSSSSRSKVWAMWSPEITTSGQYSVDVYIHKPYSKTGNARYKVHGVRGQNSEVLVAVNQAQNVNNWYRLGVFDFDANLPNSGRVFLNDVTGTEEETLTFDAVRWRRVVAVRPVPTTNIVSSSGTITVNGVIYADGFDSPVGNRVNSGDRTGTRIWPSGWRDASPYPEPYLWSSSLGRYTSVHTGADLNWGSGPYDDEGQEIYSIASGTVIFANERPEWGNLVVIVHDPYIKDGRKVASRYAHLKSMKVSVGMRVTRGELIGVLGGTRGRPGASWVPHLHFDITPASTLEKNAEDWPAVRYRNGLTVATMSHAQYETWIANVQADILKTYLDPKSFIEEHRPNR
ncbi:MAG: peptidoglycan DD-metalloendopeptidase family protein [Phototrophicaceae bacterium]